MTGQGRGLYILTGSATPNDDARPPLRELAGFGVIAMRPMSLFESGHSNGERVAGRVVRRRLADSRRPAPELR